MSRTGWRSTGRFARRSAGRLLIMVAALAGLFAMHGLSEHGVMHHEMSSMSSMPADVMSAVSAVALEDIAVEAMAAAGTEQARAMSLDAGMAMALCLTILAGLVVLVLRARGRWTGVLLRPATSDPGARLARTSRDPDPPDLFVLSIQRC